MQSIKKRPQPTLAVWGRGHGMYVCEYFQRAGYGKLVTRQSTKAFLT